MENRLNQSVQDQIARVFVFIDRAIEGANHELWHGIDPKEKGIWQHCAHMIEVLDFYLCDNLVDSYEWNALFGIDWEDFGNKSAPGQIQMKAYSSETKEKILGYLNQKADEDFLGEEKQAKWTGATPLDKAIYAVRHTTHHIGEINQIFRRHDLPVIEQDR